MATGRYLGYARDLRLHDAWPASAMSELATRHAAHRAGTSLGPYRGIEIANGRLVIADWPVTPITTRQGLPASRGGIHRRRRRITTNDLAGLLEGTKVLTLQNHVNLSNLTNIRSLNAGSLTTRAWETLRAAVQGTALTRAMRPIREGGNPDARNLAAWVDQDLPRMRRGAERC